MLLVKRAKRFHELYFFTEASQLRGRRPGKKERRKDTSFFGRNRVRPVVTLRESSEVEEFHRRVAIIDVGAVSYTHLDVYKRQVAARIGLHSSRSSEYRAD